MFCVQLGFKRILTSLIPLKKQAEGFSVCLKSLRFVQQLWPCDRSVEGLQLWDLKLDMHSPDPRHAASEACFLLQNNHIHFI